MIVGMGWREEQGRRGKTAPQRPLMLQRRFGCEISQRVDGRHGWLLLLRFTTNSCAVASLRFAWLVQLMKLTDFCKDRTTHQCQMVKTVQAL